MTLLAKLAGAIQSKQPIPGYQAPQGLGALANVVGEAKPEVKPITSVLTENTKPVGSLGAAKQPVLASRTATQTPVNNPVRSIDKPAPVPQKTQTFSSIPSNKLAKPFSKMAFARNTGIVDVDGNTFVNDEDAELLGKLGFDIDVDEYIELEKTSEVYDLYSYIEKIAGVPKAVSSAVDKGEAFSGSLLEDMGYSVPEGYEVKGDLCCPIEKDESLYEKVACAIKKASTDTPYGRPTVENPYPGIIGDLGVNALEAGAVYGANKMRNNSVQAALGKSKVPINGSSLLGKARMYGNIAKAAPAVGVVTQANGAYDRYKKQDYLGSAIDGVGALGSAAQMAPHPVAKGVGLGVSAASTVANAARDIHRYNNRPVEFRHDPAVLSNPGEASPSQNPVQLKEPLAKQGANRQAKGDAWQIKLMDRLAKERNSLRKEEALEQIKEKYDAPPVPMIGNNPVYGGIASYEKDPDISKIKDEKIPDDESGYMGVTKPENMLRQVYGDKYLQELEKAHAYNKQNEIPVDLTSTARNPQRMFISGKSGNVGGENIGPTAYRPGMMIGINNQQISKMRSDNPFFGYAPLTNQNVKMPVVKDDRGVPEFNPIGNFNVNTSPSVGSVPDYSKNTYNVGHRARVAIPASAAYEHELTHPLYPSNSYVENDFKYSYPTATKPVEGYFQVTPDTPNASYFGSMPHERTTGIAAMQRDMFNSTGGRLNTPQQFKDHVNNVLNTGDVENTLKGSRPDALRYFRSIAPIPEPHRTNLINQDAFKAPGIVQNSRPKVDKVAEFLVKTAQNILQKSAEATHELKSSNIKAVGYDKKEKELEVHFHSGGEYKYSDVPASLFHRLLKVKSPGKFFHKHVKKDNPFEYERLNKEKEAAENVVSPHNSIGNIRDNMDNMTGTAISNAAKYTTDKFVKPYVQAHPEQVKALAQEYVPKAINATIKYGPGVVENLNKVEPVLGNVGDKLISPVRSIMPAMEQAGKMVSPPLNIAENIVKSPQIDSAISNATGSLSAPVNPSFKKTVGSGANTLIFNTALQKMIPGAGGLVSAVSASERAAKGDRLGAYIDRVAAVASGLAPIPYTWPVAVPVSIGANLTNMSRDIYNSNADKYKKFLEAPRSSPVKQYTVPLTNGAEEAPKGD